jgi:hypothetical protein
MLRVPYQVEAALSQVTKRHRVRVKTLFDDHAKGVQIQAGYFFQVLTHRAVEVSPGSFGVLFTHRVFKLQASSVKRRSTEEQVTDTCGPFR